MADGPGGHHGGHPRSGRALPAPAHHRRRRRLLRRTDRSRTPWRRSVGRPTCPAGRPGPAVWPPTPTARSTLCSGTTPTGSTPTSPYWPAPRLPRHRPYNGFVILPDGHLVTKDFAGVTPGRPGGRRVIGSPASWWSWSPTASRIVDRCTLVRAVHRPPVGLGTTRSWWSGTPACCAVRWDGRLHPDEHPPVRYRTLPGQTYGWDCVIALGAAWFLDDGEGSEALLRDPLRARRLRRPRSTWCGWTSSDGRLHPGRGVRPTRRPGRQPAGRRRRPRPSPWATTAGTP